MRRKRLNFRKKRKHRKKRIHLKQISKIGMWIFKIAVVCLLAFVSVWYFGQKVSTVGDSMKPILRNGDVVLVNVLYIMLPDQSAAISSSLSQRK